MKILIADSISPRAIEIFEQAKGLKAEVRTGLSEDELVGLVSDYDAMIVRSATKVTRKVIEAATTMKVIGRAGSGVDNIDVKAATRKGIAVMNTPGANTTSTAEHAFAMLIALCRNIPQAYNSMKSGKWDRKRFQGVELRGKVLGILGLGNIGKALARKARGFEMKILGYDPFITKETAAKAHIGLTTLEELLGESDFISVHTPLNAETKHLINARSLTQCKKGVRVLNCARGGIVDEQALVEAIEAGQVAGAAFDVFESEPPSNESALLGNDKIIYTPHLGASTEEAQESVAALVAEQMVDALCKRGMRNTVNVPAVDNSEMETLWPFLQLGEMMGGMQYQMAEGQMREITAHYQGNFGQIRTEFVTTSIVKAFLAKATNDTVNHVNARALATDRGLKVAETHSETSGDYVHLISVCYATSEGEHRIDGTVFGKNDLRIVAVDGFRLNAAAEGNGLLYTNDDRPGMLASVTAALAENDINIASMYLARRERGGNAMVLINVDTPISEKVQQTVASLDGVHKVRAIDFS